MAQSLAKILIHIVFSTKDRYPFLDPEVRPELHAYATTVLSNIDTRMIAVNSTADHIHVLCNLSREQAVSHVIKQLKITTSQWLKTKGGVLEKFYWQAGYGVFSVSPSQADAVKTYILNQEVHHQRVSFEDELRSLLKKHEIEYDERYVWS